MAVSPLWALGLLLCSPSAASPSSSEGASVWLFLPSASGDASAAALSEIEDAATTLLGPSAKRRGLSDETGAETLVWSAPDWDAALEPAKRNALRESLLQRWGVAVRFDDPSPPDASTPVPARRRPEAAAVAGSLERGLAAPQAPGALDRFFDGQLTRAGVLADLPGSPLVPKNITPPAQLPRAQLPRGFPTVSAPPPSGASIDSSIRAAAESAGVDPAVFRALVQAKSGFDPARRGGGAYGLTMISPGAAAEVGMKGADLNDPQQNLKAGALYYAKMLKAFRGDTHRALAAYQAGPGAVFKSGGIPNRPDVKSFLASYERAYRSPGAGLPKPPVKMVVVPMPAARMAADAIVSLAVHDPKDPIARYRPLVEKHATKYGVDPDLVMAIMKRENPWGDSKRESSAGALGVMQLMPETARQLHVDPRNPDQAIRGAVQHLKWLLETFDGDKVKAVAAYNAGHVPVQKLGRVPNYQETVTYVAEVFANYEDLTGKKVDYSDQLTPRAQRWADRVVARRI